MMNKIHKWLFFKIEHADDWMYDHMGRVWGWIPWRGLNRIACFALGHVPISDTCCLPAHDFCAYCGKTMPGAA